MKEIPLTNGTLLAPFFKYAYDSCPEAFIQGVMGRGFTDSFEHPTCGIIQVGDFCFFGGSCADAWNYVIFVLRTLHRGHDMIFVPLSREWNRLLSDYPTLYPARRYALDKPGMEDFDKEVLISYINRVAYDPDYSQGAMTQRFRIIRIDETYYASIRKQNWSKDLSSNYPNYRFFRQWGFGFLVQEVSTGKIVAGASSFSSSRDSIEIEIDTAPEYRRRGLATAVAARMVLECIRRDKYPSWDAANLISVRIAEKLGYHLEEEYICYTTKKKEAR